MEKRCCFCGRDLSEQLSTGEIRGELGNKVLANLCSDCCRKYMLLQQNCSIMNLGCDYTGKPVNELIRELRCHACYSKNGKAGNECIVPKTLLADVAERLEALSKLDEFIDKWNAIGV